MQSNISQYNVSFDTPGSSVKDFMPLGNGDISINVWVERDGDLLFYMGKTDSWDENMRLVKLGRIRVNISPNPFAGGLPFKQELDLKNGLVSISAGQKNEQIHLCLWVDANHPVIRIEAKGEQAFTLSAALEIWRDKERVISKEELSHSDPYNYSSISDSSIAQIPETIEYPDCISETLYEGITWYHKNSTSAFPATMQLQGLNKLMETTADPLMDRIFGGAMVGEGFTKESSKSLKTSKPTLNAQLDIHILTMHPTDVDTWESELGNIIEEDCKGDLQLKKKEHKQWWKDFWNRSYIEIKGVKGSYETSRGYALQRYMVVCGGRGKFPLKFNGSNIIVSEKFTPDHRLWAGAYWFQNQRLVYWPLMVSGDFECVRPFFQMYKDALELAKERTHIYYGHAGAFFPETMTFWGTYSNVDFGWDRSDVPIHYAKNRYITHYFQGTIELSVMMLEYFEFTSDLSFLQETIMPVVNETITFYDAHYARDDKGKIHFSPAQSLETWHEAVNPMPEIAGLKYLINKLLKLPEVVADEHLKLYWKELMEQLPDIPVKEIEGKKVLVAAEELIGEIKNSENPELYGIFPYRLFGVGKDDLEMARDTFDVRRNKSNVCWRQDDIQAAYLGLSEQVGISVAERFSNFNREYRFPAVWGPHFDEIPDMDHGGVGQTALQSMLPQSEENKILLFPAWPLTWDVDFKLRAPMNTTIEGSLRGGQVTKLVVIPEVRYKDIVLPNGL